MGRLQHDTGTSGGPAQRPECVLTLSRVASDRFVAQAMASNVDRTEDGGAPGAVTGRIAHQHLAASIMQQWVATPGRQPPPRPVEGAGVG